MQDAPDLKSQVCLAGSILKALILDVSTGRPLCVKKSLGRDLQTITERLKSEGIAFCTTTLPTLSKAILSSFNNGRFDCPLGFSKEKGTTLPRLLGGLLKDVYRDDGAFLTKPCTASISELIQISKIGYKLEVPFKKELNQKVLNNFLETERELSLLNFDLDSDDPVIKLSRSMIADVFQGFSPEKCLPKHGPGTVATGEFGPKKWGFVRKYKNLHEGFPYYDFFVSSRNHLFDRLDWYKSLVKEDFGYSEVLLVPKDSRGPRLISREPLEYQFIQQGVWIQMKHLIQTHKLTWRRVNFDDQSINRDLAMLGSYFDSWATLDMRDASDRVHNGLVLTLFKDSPILLKSLQCSRSRGTTMPDGTKVDFHKFAPMGSATCFPVESIVHFVLAVSSIACSYSLSVEEASKFVFVYGDDLIIHPLYAKHVMNTLPLYGLRFNEGKCFIHGPFRESCGYDAYLGTDVSPTYWRNLWPQRLDAVSVQSFCEFASQLYVAGYLQAANLVWGKIERSLQRKLPVTPLSQNPSYLSRKTRFDVVYTPNMVRYNKDLHYLEHRALMVKDKTFTKDLDGYSSLFRFHLEKGLPPMLSEHQEVKPEILESPGSSASKWSLGRSTTIDRWTRLLK